MNAHTDIQLTLYDYLRGDLKGEERTTIESHLAACAACREECERMRETLRLLPVPPGQPSDALPDAFWTGMLNTVDHAISAQEHPRPLRQRTAANVRRFSDWLTMAVAPHRQLALVAASVAIVATSAFVTWSLLRHEPEPAAVAESTTPLPASVSPAPETRMDSYLRRSGMLLVAVANAPLDEGRPVDLSVEQETSLELVDEARALKHQALDDRSLELINGLEKIQIELANMESRNQVPTIALVRSSIERENLLFKIRIQEALLSKVSYADHE